MEKLKAILNEKLQSNTELRTHPNFERRLKWELIEIEVQDMEQYFLDLYENKKVFATNENNLLICKLLGLVDSVNLDDEPNTKNGEYPDVDVDYLPMVRDYLKNVWAPQRFGHDKVCNIGNYGTFGLKSTFIDMARVHGLDRGEILQITTNLRLKDDEGEALTYEKALEIYPELNKYCLEHPDVAKAVQKLLHRNRSMGKHAGGLILCNQSIDQFVPLVRGTEGEAVSAWVEGLSGQDLGPVGLIKFDLLVVNSLWQIALTVKMIKKRKAEVNISALKGQWDWSDLSYLDDPKCMQVANAGDLKCVFQYDSEGIRKLARKSGVTCFNDLVNLVALYRPGPLNQSMDETYALRKNGKVSYELHPVLEPILGKSYGVMIFQEDIMKILNAVGKIPLRDCYIVIKAISKKKASAFQKYKDRFIENGQIVLGVSAEEALKLWEQIESFAEYGFNKTLTEDTIIYCVDGSKKIKDIRAGDKVYCVNQKGEQVQTEVVAVHDHGILDVVEVTFDDGYSVKCTFDHKFLTEEGQVPLWKIIKDNLVVLSSPLGDLGAKKNSDSCALWTNIQQPKQVCQSSEELQQMQKDIFYAPITATGNLVHRRVLRVVPMGKRQCYDLEVAINTHNFILPNGIVTSNSHSVAYSYISARQLYLKVYYPLEFYTSTLQCENDDVKLREYITEATNHGVMVNPLHINKSKETFSIVDDEIYIGFSNIKGIGEDKAKKIVSLQPYSGFLDFLDRFGTEATVLRALIPLAIFDEASPEILYKFWVLFAEYQKAHKERVKRFELSMQKITDDLSTALPEHLRILKVASLKNLEVLANYVQTKNIDNRDFLLQVIEKTKKKVQARIKSHAEKMLARPSLSTFLHDEISIEDKKVLDVLRNPRLAQETYYGYPWDNRIKNISDYKPDRNFANQKIQAEQGVLFTTVMCEIIEVNVKSFKNKKGKFASITVMDDNFEIGRITIWEEDYERFKSELKKGNLISIQVCPPSNGFSSYTFRSPPKHKRYELPKEKKMDYRLVLLENGDNNE